MAIQLNILHPVAPQAKLSLENNPFQKAESGSAVPSAPALQVQRRADLLRESLWVQK